MTHRYLPADAKTPKYTQEAHLSSFINLNSRHKIWFPFQEKCLHHYLNLLMQDYCEFSMEDSSFIAEL